jgi:hypothetical protein
MSGSEGAAWRNGPGAIPEPPSSRPTTNIGTVRCVTAKTLWVSWRPASGSFFTTIDRSDVLTGETVAARLTRLLVVRWRWGALRRGTGTRSRRPPCG